MVPSRACILWTTTVLLVLAAASPTILPTAKAEPPFLPDVRVNSGPEGVAQTEPSLAVDAAGNLYVAWTDYRNGTTDIYFARSTDRGATWTDPNVRVNTDATSTNQFEPNLVASASGTLYLGWTDYRNGNADIYFAKSTDGGATWTDPNVRVNTDATSTDQNNVSLAVDASGTIYAIWSDGRGVWWDVYFAKSTDGGATWTDPNVRVDDGSPLTWQQEPVLAVAPSGALYAAWRYMDTDFDIYFANSTDGGITWTNPNVRLNTDNTTGWQREPSIAVDASGAVLVAWDDGRNNATAYDIYLARSADGGATWMDPNVRVNTDTSNAWQMFPKVGADAAGNAYVVWWDEEGFNVEDFNLGVSTDGGVTWPGPDLRVNDPPPSWPPQRRDPTLAVTADGVVAVAWSDFRNGQPDIYFTILVPSAVQVSVEGFVSPQPGILHIVPADPRFNFTYENLESRPLAQYTVSVWDEAGTTVLWSCTQTPLTPVPRGTTVSERYNTAPCPTDGPPLADGTTYELRVLVTDVDGRTGPPTVVDFHMNEVLAPVSPLPLDDVRIPCSNAQTVGWSSPGVDAEGDSPVSYAWQVASDSAFTSIVASGSGATPVSATFNTCPGGEFYWRANLTDGWEQGGYGNPPVGFWNFTTFTPNSPPTVNPVRVDGYDAATAGILHILSDHPTVSWTYADANGDPQAAYEIRVGTTPGGSDAWSSGGIGAATSVAYGGVALADGTDYYVDVRASDGENVSAWSEVRFHTNAVPGIPVLTLPADGATDVTSGTVVLRWSTVADTDMDAVAYDWYVSLASDFSTLAASGQVTSAIATFNADASTTCYWRVRAWDGWEASANSTMSSFTTTGPPPTEGNITVHVTDLDLYGIVGATVRLEDNQGTLLDTKTTGVTGNVTFSGLSFRQYVIRVSAPGYRNGVRTAAITSETPNVVVDVPLPLLGGGPTQPDTTWLWVLLIVFVVVVVLLLVFFLWRRKKQKKSLRRWRQLRSLQAKHEVAPEDKEGQGPDKPL